MAAERRMALSWEKSAQVCFTIDHIPLGAGDLVSVSAEESAGAEAVWGMGTPSEAQRHAINVPTWNCACDVGPGSEGSVGSWRMPTDFSRAFGVMGPKVIRRAWPPPSGCPGGRT